MKYRKNLVDIVNNLNNKYFAFEVYIAGRVLDHVSTALAIHKLGIDIESNMVYRYMMEKCGPYFGPALHEFTGTLLAIGIYKLCKKMDNLHENVVPYIIGVGSMALSVNNFYVYFTS